MTRLVVIVVAAVIISIYKHGFYCAWPTARNALPHELTAVTALSLFVCRGNLNTFLFNLLLVRSILVTFLCEIAGMFV